MNVKHAPIRALLLPGALLAASTVAACQGCRTVPDGAGQGQGPTAGPPPSVRLYFVSSVAGALEPCGCSKNQLGGVDHLGAFVAAQAKGAPVSLMAGVGPMLFPDPTPRGDHATQDTWRAEAMAAAFSKMGLAAWAPGANDWAEGATLLGKLRERAGAALVAANLSGEVAGGVPAVVRKAGEVQVGFVGISSPMKLGLAPQGVTVKPPREALAGAIAEAKKQGAQVLVGLFAMPRGEALRLAEAAPELHVVAVGKPFDQGEANDKPTAPVLLGQTLVVETANHLQTTAIVDLFVRDGRYEFQDAAGVSRQNERDAVSKRIEDLEKKVRSWEQNASIAPTDLAARKAELAAQQAELRRLETPPPPPSGSFFRYTMQPVRQDLGSDAALHAEMLAYYDRVNEHNRKAFADRKPAPPGPDGNRYIGVEACSSCHAQAREVWARTQHAHAYKTLSTQHKEFNLDCVSCHVTGYGKPGGSTVTGNEALQNVQCEECHGPGERHRQAPNDKSLIVAKPSPDLCVSACHHPPHVEGFDPVAQMHKVLGPGHGNIANWLPKQ